MSPFVYPDQPQVRQHGPQGYRDLGSFRPWLRDEFSFRCVCCLRREAWDRAVSLEIDHFLPKSRVPELGLEYDNLLYICRRCNAAKGVQAIPSGTILNLMGWRWGG
jgi:5-methylcytosine-specific restriction endonuclease McrA